MRELKQLAGPMSVFIGSAESVMSIGSSVVVHDVIIFDPYSRFTCVSLAEVNVV